MFIQRLFEKNTGVCNAKKIGTVANESYNIKSEG